MYYGGPSESSSSKKKKNKKPHKKKPSPYAKYDQDLASLLLPPLNLPGYNGPFPGNVQPPQEVLHSTMLHRKHPKESKKQNNVPDASDAMDALFNQLLNMVSAGGGATVDYESALKDSEAAIRDAYANDIAAIREGNAGARKDTAKNRRAVEQAYRGLAKNFVKTGKMTTRQGKGLSKAINANAQQSADYLQNAQSKQMKEQANLAEGLGIEDAMPSATAGSTREANNAIHRIVNEGTRSANKQLGFAGNEQRFLNRGGVNARLEGTNRSADLLADLQDYIQGNRTQIAGLKSQRDRELAANENDVMSSVAQMQADAQSDQWDRLMDLAGLKQDIDKEQFDQEQALHDYKLKLMSQGGSSDSMPGADNFANAQQYLSKLTRQNKGTNLFDQLLNSQQMTSGYFGTGDNKTKMTPYKAMQMIEQAAKQQNLSPEDINLLRLAVWAQMG